MTRGRWSMRVAVVGLMLVAAVIPAGPAVAAQCTTNCFTYVADISVTGSTYPPSPVPPGSMHSYTGTVTNTGWRLGGPTGPTPWPGPASSIVYFGFRPATTDDVPQSCYVNIGPPLGCFGAYHGLAYDLGSMPTNTSYEFTVFFQAPQISGTYTLTIRADDLHGRQAATDYYADNNSLTITYHVGYQA